MAQDFHIRLFSVGQDKGGVIANEDKRIGRMTMDEWMGNQRTEVGEGKETRREDEK